MNKKSRIKDFKSKLKSLDYRHYIASAITLAFAIITIFVFPDAFIRIGESLRDLWYSLLYYIKELFYLDWDIPVSVNAYSQVPWTPFLNLPATWEEFVVKWHEYWQVFATWSNLQSYFAYLGDLLFNISRILLLIVIPLLLILYMLFNRYLSKENNDYDKDSKALIRVKNFATKVYIPVKTWCKRFVMFIQDHNKYFKIWLFLWAFNFNLITIIIEFLAYYLYFVVSFDFANIYRQFYKLFCDISVPIAFIPGFAWVIIIYLFIDWLRRSMGYKKLNHLENKNCGFINERPIVMMLCGTMGKKKTTIITDIALSQEVMLREKALELILENDMKFPNFPWINLENDLKTAMDNHTIFNLATIKTYIQDKRKVWESSPTRENIYNYDFERYGVVYDDKLKINYIWDIVETYSKLYFVYIIQSSLIISNYSIRTDNQFMSLGNFPMWDTDFFQRDSKTIDENSRYAHILDFDSLRLGKKLVEDNIKKDSFEFGVVNITEVGKERKNNLSLQEMKIKDAIANQKNDGFNDTLKMIRHSATIDNFPFIKIITDEQRPESWGADARDLLEIVTIDETLPKQLAMPFFALTELLYGFVFDKFTNLYYKYRFKRSDNTLPMYMLKKLVSMFNHFYNGIYNTFGYCYITSQVENGTMDGKVLERKYYIMFKKIYSRRFSTDCFSDFFTQKALQSTIGIDDLEEYGTDKATFEELKKQNSYFINDLTRKQDEFENKKM